MNKLNALAIRNRIIQRSLHSISARMDGRFLSSNRKSSSLDLSHPFVECDGQNFSQEELVPQQQWDDLFESAFEVIGDTSVDIFD